MVFYAKYFQLLILENGFAKQGSCLEFRVSSSIPTIPTFFSRYVHYSRVYLMQWQCNVEKYNIFFSCKKIGNVQRKQQG